MVAAVKDAENWHKGADSRLEKVFFEDPDGATKKVCKQLMDSGELDWVTQSTLSDSANVLLDLHHLVQDYALKSVEVMEEIQPKLEEIEAILGLNQPKTDLEREIG